MFKYLCIVWLETCHCALKIFWRILACVICILFIFTYLPEPQGSVQIGLGIVFYISLLFCMLSGDLSRRWKLIVSSYIFNFVNMFQAASCPSKVQDTVHSFLGKLGCGVIVGGHGFLLNKNVCGLTVLNFHFWTIFQLQINGSVGNRRKCWSL